MEEYGFRGRPLIVIGVDLGQFILDPFGSGVQRVLQQLSHHWPEDTPAEFLVPTETGFGALDSVGAYRLLSTTFESRPADHEAPTLIANRAKSLFMDELSYGALSRRYSSWLVPEMTYEQSNLQRIRGMQQLMPVTMIAYDALPMSYPENYQFTPGTYGNVSEYLRVLRDAQTLVCISEFSRQQMFDILRRNRCKATEVAHPGGDHIPVSDPPQQPVRPMFLRVGTMEARKHPGEIVTSFVSAVDDGLEADLVFVGSPSRVDVATNAVVQRAIDSDYPVRWVTDATDSQVVEHMSTATAFMSYGIEGYGIPVLEAIRRGLPVLFDGIQPASDVMEGRGATRVPLGADATAWRSAVTKATEARSHLDPNGVPTWSSFATAIAECSYRYAPSQGRTTT